MHGTVVAVKLTEGSGVEAGQPAFVIEAMKMENEIASPRSGTVRSVAVALGDTVEEGQVLAAVE
jgi:acetyl-CoA/propionyl-CoA carboxylase biotin carboxyl carrier protein